MCVFNASAMNETSTDLVLKSFKRIPKDKPRGCKICGWYLKGELQKGSKFGQVSKCQSTIQVFRFFLVDSTEKGWHLKVMQYADYWHCRALPIILDLPRSWRCARELARVRAFIPPFYRQVLFPPRTLVCLWLGSFFLLIGTLVSFASLVRGLSLMSFPSCWDTNTIGVLSPLFLFLFLSFPFLFLFLFPFLFTYLVSSPFRVLSRSPWLATSVSVLCCVQLCVFSLYTWYCSWMCCCRMCSCNLFRDGDVWLQRVHLCPLSDLGLRWVYRCFGNDFTVYAGCCNLTWRFSLSSWFHAKSLSRGS